MNRIVLIVGLVGVMLYSVSFNATAEAHFGIEHFEASAVRQDLSPEGVAGSHPWELATGFKVLEKENTLTAETEPDENIKDAYVALPPGFVGNPLAVPQCSPEEFNERGANSTFLSNANCSENTQIGLVEIKVFPEFPVVDLPIYNLIPEHGSPATFAFNVAGVPVILEPHIRTGEDYGVTVASRNTSQGLQVFSVRTVLWGVPADASHDELRGQCLGPFGSLCSHPSGVKAEPFLSMPTECSETGLEVSLLADSWQTQGTLTPFGFPQAGDPRWVSPAPAIWPALTGCEHLDFSPKIRFSMEQNTPNTPTGLVTELRLPQEENPIGLREADLKRTEVRLPEGFALSPSSADGRAACSPAQIGLNNPGKPECPDASKVGSVELHTPLLAQPLEGSIYLAQQESFGKGLFALYLVAEGSGIILKVPGEVHLNEETGQVTTVFDNNPQQPFDDLKLHFFGGARGALSTPPACGTYNVNSVLTPWSGTEPVAFEDPLTIGSSCGIGFSPSFTAGTTINQAGGFSPFSVTLSRSDQDQFLGGVSVTTPPGLLGMLSQVPLCGEPQAQKGACPAASRIGKVTVGAGPGSDPVWVSGEAFLTGPYGGGPFGLSIVVPVKAGPFDFGIETVRAAIHVDPHTSQLTIDTPAIPHIVKGIPLQIHTIHVEIDRTGFMFNPTDCEPLALTGTVTSTQGASAAVSSHFQAANCVALAFHPKLTASTQAKTSRANGASLDVKIAYPHGSEANIHKVAVSLPRQLPSRLTTIQKACREATFAANPAACPVASNIGTATAVTPVLNVPLTGPAYLVSRGGAAFPDLVMILQGEGVTLDIVGSINIDKRGVTSSTFSSVPDAPISSFELHLPVGPHSALTATLPKKAHNSLCGSRLVMPTTITGQNGAQIEQSTKIAVTGCHRSPPRKHRRK
jgi:hypothetical protein